MPEAICCALSSLVERIDFAKDSHKRAVSRWFDQGAHTIHIPSRLHSRRRSGKFTARGEHAVMGLANSYLASIIG